MLRSVVGHSPDAAAADAAAAMTRLSDDGLTSIMFEALEQLVVLLSSSMLMSSRAMGDVALTSDVERNGRRAGGKRRRHGLAAEAFEGVVVVVACLRNGAEELKVIAEVVAPTEWKKR